MDAGGLAQMSYNNFPVNNGLRIPGSGFAARHDNNVKPLSFEPKQPNVPTDHGAPRTSRSHLLAGLRTAPKSATYNNMPSTAPPTQQHFQPALGLASSMYAQEEPSRTRGYAQQNAYNPQMFPVAEQILAPPNLRADENAQEQMDPNLYAQLVATNMYLAEQQQRLQQQLMNVQAAAQEMQGLNLGKVHQFTTPPVTPQNLNMFHPLQVKQQMQPIITPVAGAQPGVYSYYNPTTGQQSYFMDSGSQHQYKDVPVMQTVNYSPPQQPGTPRFQVSPPPDDDTFRSVSPPKKLPSPPADVTPLPPPSAGAFRPGHRRAESMAFDRAIDSPRLASTPKIPGMSSIMTPVTAGFGPGQARAGEHPIRQPRGPPSLDELKAKPTTKFEGSKNFATRTRRSAVHNLVRAGMERRRAGDGLPGSMSPISEVGELSMSSEDDCSESGRTGRPSVGSSRASAHGAIGSDRPSRNNSFERKSTPSIDSAFSRPSPALEDGNLVGGSFAAIFKNGAKKSEASVEKKKAPMLILTSAEKRKSSLF